MAIQAARAADEKKAEDILVLDLRDLTVVTDYFVICSGTTNTHVRAILEGVQKRLAEAGVFPRRREGDHTTRWALLDYGDVVVHVFHHVERDYYDLERLWASAPQVEWRPEEAVPETAGAPARGEERLL